MRASTTQRIANPNRLRPLRALRALRTVTRNPEDTSAGVVMVDSLAGRSIERHFVRFRRDPFGARILAERRSLYARLSDRDGLCALPAGSLGRRYFEWTRDEQISVEGLALAVNAVISLDALDDERRFVSDRGRDMHDLWHLATGYGRDMLGENALLVFTLRQTRNTGLILPCLVGAVGSRFLSREGPPLVRDAWRRAGRAVWLPVAPWEDLLAAPLDVVRRALRLGEPPVYAPIRSEGSPVGASA